MDWTRRNLCGVLAGGVSALTLARIEPLGAQEAYPTRGVKVVVPFPAGAGSDVVMRLIAEQMARDLGQNFIVENQIGASGAIGTATIAKAAPDGYTLGVGGTSALATAERLVPNLSYNPRNDLTQIALLATFPQILAVNGKLGISSLADLIAQAKANPGKLNFGSLGRGTSYHFGGELLKLRAGVDLTHVPYTKSSDLLSDLMTGRIELSFSLWPIIQSQVKDGTLKALAVSTPARLPGLADVPTFAELGFDNFNLMGWISLMGPAKLPPEIVAKLNKSANAALATPSVAEKIAATGGTPGGGTPEAMQRYLESEIALLGQLMDHLGMTKA